jgi:hypothetical protein
MWRLVVVHEQVCKVVPRGAEMCTRQLMVLVSLPVRAQLGHGQHCVFPFMGMHGYKSGYGIALPTQHHTLTHGFMGTDSQSCA